MCYRDDDLNTYQVVYNDVLERKVLTFSRLDYL